MKVKAAVKRCEFAAGNSYAALAKCAFTLWKIVAGIYSTRGPLSFFVLTVIAIPPASSERIGDYFKFLPVETNYLAGP